MINEKETKEEEKKNENVCGMPCECFSRVTGYYRPVSNWNKGKQEEFKERKKFNVGCCCGGSN